MRRKLILGTLSALLLYMLTCPAVLESGTINWQSTLRQIYSSGGYPRVVELSDGSLLATFDHPISGGAAIACVKSTNGGVSWGSYQRIAQDTNGTVDMANAFPVQFSDGTIVVAFRHHTLNQSIYRIEICKSTNGGSSWTFQGTVEAGTSSPLWEPFLMFDQSGNLQCYYTRDDNGNYHRVVKRTSTNKGQTWGSYSNVTTVDGDGMPGVTRLADNSLICAFETWENNRFIVRAVRSYNDGQSWSSTRELVYAPSQSYYSAGAPYIIQLKSGDLLCSFQTDEDYSGVPPYPRNEYINHCTFKYVKSADNGQNWGSKTTVLGGPSRPATWNALYQISNTNILALTSYWGRPRNKIATYTQTVVFQDNFNDGNANGWTSYGTWAVESGQYSGTSSTSDAKAAAGSTAWINYTYEATVNVKSGVDGGLLFRVQALTGALDGGKYYYFYINPGANQWGLGKANYGWQGLTSGSRTLNYNTTYTLKVKAEGNNFTFYINGQQVGTYTDTSSPYTWGRIGLRTFRGHTHFDNTKVTG